MNKQTYDRACELKQKMDEIKWQLSLVPRMDNKYGVSIELFNRHKAEITEYLQGEYDKLAQEFESL